MIIVYWLSTMISLQNQSWKYTEQVRKTPNKQTDNQSNNDHCVLTQHDNQLTEPILEPILEIQNKEVHKTTTNSHSV